MGSGRAYRHCVYYVSSYIQRFSLTFLDLECRLSYDFNHVAVELLDILFYLDFFLFWG